MKVVCIVAAIILLIVLVPRIINSNCASVQTYTCKSSGYGGGFRLNFDKGTYEYSVNSFETLGGLPIFGDRIITKSGNLLDCRETENGRAKYNQARMDYYIWVSADQKTTSYAFYTFVLE